MKPLPRNTLKGRYPRCHYNKLGKTKQVFDTLQQAEDYLIKINNPTYTIYKCTYCNKYHIAH